MNPIEEYILSSDEEIVHIGLDLLHSEYPTDEGKRSILDNIPDIGYGTRSDDQGIVTIGIRHPYVGWITHNFREHDSSLRTTKFVNE